MHQLHADPARAVKTRDPRPELRAAAFSGKWTEVQRLLQECDDVNHPDQPDGLTALHAAAAGGHEVVVQTLLAHGAVLHSTDQDGSTPLHVASFFGHTTVVQLLLAQGANARAKDKHGHDPVEVAAMCGHEEVVKLLAVHQAAQPGWARATAMRTAQLCKDLLHRHRQRSKQCHERVHTVPPVLLSASRPISAKLSCSTPPSTNTSMTASTWSHGAPWSICTSQRLGDLQECLSSGAASMKDGPRCAQGMRSGSYSTLAHLLLPDGSFIATTRTSSITSASQVGGLAATAEVHSSLGSMSSRRSGIAQAAAAAAALAAAATVPGAAASHDMAPHALVSPFLMGAVLAPHRVVDASPEDRTPSISSSAGSQPFPAMPTCVPSFITVAEEAGLAHIPPTDLHCTDLLGSGAYGDVYRAQWNGAEVAVKWFQQHGSSLPPHVVQSFKTELALLSQLEHPHVLRLLGVVAEGPKLGLVMEFMPGGSLHAALHGQQRQPLSGKQRLCIAVQIAKALHYCHSRKPKVVHRDLTSANVLLDGCGHVRVCDFGLAQLLRSTVLSAKSSVGTIAWAAPEAFWCDCNEKCDVWSFGVVLWELLTNQPPWQGWLPPQIMMAVCLNRQRLPIPPDIDAPVSQLLHDCWLWQPHKRPSFAVLLKRLSCLHELHPTSAQVAYKAADPWASHHSSVLSKRTFMSGACCVGCFSAASPAEQ